MKRLKSILANLCMVTMFLTAPVYDAYSVTTNLPDQADVGDYGSWATDNNRDLLIDDLQHDMSIIQDAFNQNQMVADYVPIEAKVGLAFMNAMSWVGNILDNSLVRFVKVFLIIGFMFWIVLEAYAMMTKGDGNIKKLAEDIVKKGGLIAIWIIVLSFGPAKIFLYVMGPVLTVGTVFADLILNAVTGVAGVSLPDTCAAIQNYAAANARPDMLIDGSMAANIMCLPTRLSGFFYTAISAGFSWMWTGIGTSAFTFFVGALFVVLFAVNMWKFALMALGVIADLFMGILMLPFTAISETLGKTSYKGIAGNIFNGFLGLFKAESLSNQIQRFVNAAIYFVSLSIVISICVALLSGTVSADMATETPSLENDGYLVTVLTGCLVYYLASISDKLAKQLGGSIDGSMGEKMGKDAVNLTKSGYKGAKGWIKAIRKK